MEKESLPVAIYGRVSPTKHLKDEEDQHRSLEESIRICEADVEREGNHVVAIFKDQYISGKSAEHMIEFQKMMNQVRNKENVFKRIYCRRVNRFGRNLQDMIKAEYELHDEKISLKFVEGQFDTGTVIGRGVMLLMSSLAELDRKEILENTSRGRKRAMAEGVQFGRKKKELDLQMISDLRKNNTKDPITNKPKYTWLYIEKLTGVTRTTIIKRLKEANLWDEVTKFKV